MKQLMSLLLLAVIVMACQKTTISRLEKVYSGETAMYSFIASNDSALYKEYQAKMIQKNTKLPWYSEVICDKIAYWNAVNGYYNNTPDSTAPCTNGAGIVWIGNSKINNWSSVVSCWRTKPMINRGLGGSLYLELLPYIPDIVTWYKPKQVILYDGDNEIIKQAKNGTQIYNDFIQVFNALRSAVPTARITVISFEPSPRLWANRADILQYNSLVKSFLSTKTNVSYVDIYAKMLNANGVPEPTYFKSDSLHMTTPGYQVWLDEINRANVLL